ncbi:MAG: FAD-binding oxidoreductase [Gammaproteobacteria bacterium]|nr:FAD-binding oxidoreductase [Gammaproteobacteria bacterium]
MTLATARDVIIVGAGISGIATAFYLSRANSGLKITLVDALQPMSFTSAQSGENYRNWWPSPVMKDFIDQSIDLLEAIAADTENRIRLTQSGYALATRSNSIDMLLQGLGTDADVISKPKAIRAKFPAFDPEVRNVICIRRAGSLDSYTLSQHMLGSFRACGGSVVRGEVSGIEPQSPFRITLSDGRDLSATQIVIAAGPFINWLLAHLGEKLPVANVLQQKLAFEDVLNAVPLDQPFSVDLDAQQLDWTDEERDLLADDEQFRFLVDTMPGNAHRRPEGNDHCRWVRLGWAYNTEPSEPGWSPSLDDHFPEIVLRGAARLNPSLKAYYRELPAARSHYGGYYTMTEENLPIIGPLRTEGAFVVSALSGFGTMAACAAGDLCSRWLRGTALPAHAKPLSLARYNDTEFLNSIRLSSERGVL